MKIIPTTYTFSASWKTITCPDFTDIEKLAIITNLTTWVIIYQFNNATKWGTLNGKVLTLDYDTTSMSDTDELQIIIHASVLILENWETATRDINLEEVLWSQPVNEDWKIRTKSSNQDVSWNTQRVIWTNSEAKIFTNWFTTCNIQLSWTWAWTQTFEITSDWWNFVAIAWVNAASNTLAYTTTWNWIFRFNVTWLNAIRVRFSTYTSWAAIVNFSLSSWPQWQPLSQNATWVLNTTDQNIGFIAPSQMYETWFELETQRVLEPTINPTQPTSYAAPKFANFIQKFRRLRTQIAGSEMLPFSQEKNTNRMLVSQPEEIRLLEWILVELLNIRSVLMNDSNSIQK